MFRRRRTVNPGSTPIAPIASTPPSPAVSTPAQPSRDIVQIVFGLLHDAQQRVTVGDTGHFQVTGYVDAITQNGRVRLLISKSRITFLAAADDLEILQPEVAQYGYRAYAMLEYPGRDSRGTVLENSAELRRLVDPHSNRLQPGVARGITSIIVEPANR